MLVMQCSSTYLQSNINCCNQFPNVHQNDWPSYSFECILITVWNPTHKPHLDDSEKMQRQAYVQPRLFSSICHSKPFACLYRMYFASFLQNSLYSHVIFKVHGAPVYLISLFVFSISIRDSLNSLHVSVCFLFYSYILKNNRYRKQIVAECLFQTNLTHLQIWLVYLEGKRHSLLINLLCCSRNH